MSYLVIGNEVDALILGKFLKEHGWPVSFLSRSRYDYKSDCELVAPEQFKEVGFDFKKGLLTYITKMEIEDLAGNKWETDTNTVLVNMAVYKNELFKAVNKDCKFFENSAYIDKNNENIFIQHGEHGTLIKAKHVFGVNELNLSATINEPLTKNCLKATVERTAEKGKLFLKFLNTGYIWIVNYTDRVAEMCIVSDDPEKDLAEFMLDNNLKPIYKRQISIPYFKKDRVLYNRNVYLSGASALITNNLNFYNLILHLKFIQLTATFAHELMTKKNLSYSYLTKEFDEELAKYEKQGKLFWNSPSHKKNELIHKMDFKNFALDFNSCFDKLSVLSSYKIKMLFN